MSPPRVTPGESEQMFGALVDAAADAIIVIDDRGIIVQANRACTRIFGHDTDELLGQSIARLMPPAHSSRSREYIDRYRESGASRVIGLGREIQGMRANGEIFPMELSVGEGRLDGRRHFIGVVRDLSERNQLLERLRERESELTRMLDSALVPTGLLNGEGVVQRANTALAMALGLRAAEGEELAGFVVASQRASFRGTLAGVAANGSEHVFAGLPLTVEGEERWVDCYLAAVPTEHLKRRSPEIVVQFVDRTPELAAERSLTLLRDTLARYHRVSLVGAMSAGIAHQVSQPLGAIENYVEAARRIAKGESPSPDQLDEVLDKIAVQTGRAEEVIARFSALAEGQDPVFESTDANALVEATARLAAPQFFARHVELRTDLAAALPRVRVDRVQVQQVLLNLLQNALDASVVDAAKVIVRTRAGDGVVVEVEDAGQGLDPEQLGRLTDPFYTSKDGMGVGLTICRSIVDLHRGELSFWNNPDGAGATFRVRLPAEEEQ